MQQKRGFENKKQRPKTQDLKPSVIIPAYNEQTRITPVIEETKPHADEILVVNDHSTDDTARVAKEAGATVITNSGQSGYIGAIKTGFSRANSEIVVTLDADGEHDPKDIPKLVEPIETDRADVVLGKREEIARPSEKFLCALARLKVNVEDCGTGFRALRREIAKEMNLPGHCTCGTFVLEAKSLGARLTEVPINLRPVDKPRGIAWKHIPQLWHVIKLVLK